MTIEASIAEFRSRTTSSILAVILSQLEFLARRVDYLAERGDLRLNGYSRSWLCAGTAVFTLIISRLVRKTLYYDGFIPVQQRPTILMRLRQLPGIRTIVQQKLATFQKGIHTFLNSPYKDLQVIEKLPPNNWSVNDIWKTVCRYEELTPIPWKRGRCSGAVYSPNDAEIEQLMHRIFAKTLKSNPLHPITFCGVRRMEAEVIRWGLGLFNATADGAGSIASGGTESIILACKAYRDYAFATKGISCPEMVVANSVHPAFLKGAEYLRITVRQTPVLNSSLKADVAAMKKAINNNTILLVASAPGFPHGIIDPVQEIANLGHSYNIPVHVDCCLGGFVLPFMNESGYPVEPYDFRVRGVTSISADTHKYGMTPKGTSLILYAHYKYHRHQFSITTDWPGGVYGTQSMSGSRPGALIACCWATLLYNGRNGYVKACRQIIELAKAIKRGIAEIEGFEIMGDPQACVVAFTSRRFDITEWNSRMSQRHWELNALQFPLAVHLCVTMMHVREDILGDFLRDAREIANELMKNPPTKVSDSAAMYGMAESLPDRSLIHELACSYLEATQGFLRIDESIARNTE